MANSSVLYILADIIGLTFKEEEEQNCNGESLLGSGTGPHSLNAVFILQRLAAQLE